MDEINQKKNENHLKPMHILSMYTYQFHPSIAKYLKADHKNQSEMLNVQ